MFLNQLLRPHTHGRDGGFTRLELAALLAALSLLVAVALPALAHGKPRAQRLTCLSNLREIGQSFASWSSEFGSRLPMQVPASEGGTLGQPGLASAAWYQFATLSNHLRSPHLLVCPSDTAKRVARTFDQLPDGGFLHGNYRDNALSYILGHPVPEGRPDVLSGDRHLGVGLMSGSCLYWLPTRFAYRTPGVSTYWTDALHAATGNVVLSDGRVEQLSSVGLQRRLAEGASELSPEFHYLSP